MSGTGDFVCLIDFVLFIIVCGYYESIITPCIITPFNVYMQLKHKMMFSVKHLYSLAFSLLAFVAYLNLWIY